MAFAGGERGMPSPSSTGSTMSSSQSTVPSKLVGRAERGPPAGVVVYLASRLLDELPFKLT